MSPEDKPGCFEYVGHGFCMNFNMFGCRDLEVHECKAPQNLIYNS